MGVAGTTLEATAVVGDCTFKAFGSWPGMTAFSVPTAVPSDEEVGGSSTGATGRLPVAMLLSVVPPVPSKMKLSAPLELALDVSLNEPSASGAQLNCRSRRCLA